MPYEELTEEARIGLAVAELAQRLKDMEERARRAEAALDKIGRRTHEAHTLAVVLSALGTYTTPDGRTILRDRAV